MQAFCYFKVGKTGFWTNHRRVWLLSYWRCSSHIHFILCFSCIFSVKEFFISSVFFSVNFGWRSNMLVLPKSALLQFYVLKSKKVLVDDKCLTGSWISIY